MAAAIDVHNSFVAQFEHLPALRTRGHLEMRFAFQRGHINLAAQSRDRKWNWHLAIQIIAFALKDFVFLDMNHDVKVAGQAAADAGLTIAQRPQPGAFPDSSGNLQLNPAQFFNTPLAAAFRAWLFNYLTGAMTARTRLRNVKEST
jgi:hypothetical protein